MVKYNSWPLGHLPAELRRPELEEIKKYGYAYTDARDIVDIFEEKVAKFTGSGYAVSVDCCTHALELCFRYLLAANQLIHGCKVKLPEHTYISVPMMLRRIGLIPELYDHKWRSKYKFVCQSNIDVWDAATEWMPDMYIKGSLMCLSFQIKKRIPIGRGGMILTDNQDLASMLKRWRYDGRAMEMPYDNPNHIQSYGFHYYMTPEDAARGILLMDRIKDTGDSGEWINYPNLKQWQKFF